MQFFSNPDEAAEFMNAQYEKAHLENQDAQNEFNRWLREMPPQQLVLFKDACLSMSCNPRLAAHYAGMASAILTFVLDVCTSCGKNHTAEELEKMAGEAKKDDIALPMVVSDTGTIGQSEKQLFIPSTVEKKLMEQYNLDDAYEEETGRFLGFICISCGTRYPTIQDRMLKSPDDCSGCIQKTKWG